MQKKSSMLKAEPILVCPYTLIDEPNLEKVRTDMHDEMCIAPKQLRHEPILTIP
jgi:hypothetical protein